MRTPGRRSAPRGPEIKSRADVEKVARFVETIVACPASDACRQWRPIRCTDVADGLGEGDDDQGSDDAEDRADRRHQDITLPRTPLRFHESGDESVMLGVGRRSGRRRTLGDGRLFEQTRGETLGTLVLFLARVESLDEARKVIGTSLGRLRLVRVLGHGLRLAAVGRHRHWIQ
jgi:hypothetical protein